MCLSWFAHQLKKTIVNEHKKPFFLLDEIVSVFPSPFSNAILLTARKKRGDGNPSEVKQTAREWQMLLLALTFSVWRTIISSPLNKALIRLSSLVSVLHLCTSARRPSSPSPCPVPTRLGPHVRHPVALVCLSAPQSVSLTWLHSSCASMTTWDERDCGGLISIHNEFFSPKSGFESRRWWSTARARRRNRLGELAQSPRTSYMSQNRK